MCWSIDIPDLPTLLAYPITDCDNWENKIPAWSLSALLELIPESIDDNTNDFSQLELTKKSVAYYYGDGTLKCGFLKDNFINTAFEMVV